MFEWIILTHFLLTVISLKLDIYPLNRGYLFQEKCVEDFCSAQMKVTINNSHKNDILKKNCYCDTKCFTFQDCCQDYKWEIYKLPQYLKKNEAKRLSICQQSKYTQQMPTTIKNSCPVKWYIRKIEQFCSSESQNTPLLQIPIINEKTGTAYKNIFCAICNSEELNSLQLILDIECAFLNNDTHVVFDSYFLNDVYPYKLGDSWKLILSYNENITCNLHTILNSKMVTGGQFCLPIIKTCALNWTDAYYLEKCQSFTAFRYQKDKLGNINIYKNIYCAICNYINVSELFCNFKKVSPLPQISVNQLKLFDSPKCQPNQVFDIFNKKCYCFHSNCLKKQFPRSIETFQLPAMCQYKVYNISEYGQKNNGTIYIYELQQNFTQKDYKINSKTNEVTLCVPSHSNNHTNNMITTDYEKNEFCIKVKIFYGEFYLIPNTNPNIINTSLDGMLTEDKDFVLSKEDIPIYCRTINISYVQKPNNSCWRISLPPWSYKNQSNILYVEMTNKTYNPHQYIIDERNNPAICISTDFPEFNRNKSCTKLMIPKIYIQDFKDYIYVSIFQRNYSSSHYTFDEQFKNYYVCLELRDACNFTFFAQDEYKILNNHSIFILSSSRLHKVDEYQIVAGGVLICLPSGYFYEIEESRFSAIEGYMTIVGLSISTICLVLHLLAFFLMFETKNLPGKNLASLAFSLLIAQLLWLLHPFTKTINEICTTVSIAGHFMYLASFFWMGIISFDVWRKFTQQQMQNLSRPQERIRFIKYSVVAWISPLFIVLTSVILEYGTSVKQFQPQYNQCRSLISQRDALLVFLNIPLAIVLVINFIFFLLTVIRILPEICLSRTVRPQKNHKVCIYFKLAVIMGLTWMVGFILMSPLNPVQWIQYLFIILNSLQGVFIFFSFTFSKKIRNSLRETFAKLSVKRQLSNSSSTRTDETCVSSKHSSMTANQQNGLTPTSQSLWTRL